MNKNLLCALPLSLVGLAGQASERPNIIVIMADDLGYGDISCFGSKTTNTPNLDRMASEGLKLTDFHSNGVLSSPTRAALMTGCYQQRAGINTVINAVKHRKNKGLATETITVADKLKEMGYATAITGKWHLGYDPKFNPTNYGFDHFWGFIAGNIDYQSYVDQAGYYDWWHNRELVSREVDKGYLTDAITKHSIDFIKDNNPQRSGKPFFLYVAHATPHYPYQGREDAPVRAEGSGEYTRQVAKEDIPRIYKEITEVMDEGIGQIFQTLKDLDIDDNTIVIFCSDNGPVSHGSTGGYRGKKTSVYEGGHRVPAIVRYPSKVKAGGVSDETILGMDFFPTFVDMAGGAITGLDGVSVKSHLEESTPLAERYTFWGYANKVAMRDGDWKLVELRKDNTLTQELFDLSKDPFETTNISYLEKNRVEMMSAEIAKWKTDVTPKKTE